MEPNKRYLNGINKFRNDATIVYTKDRIEPLLNKTNYPSKVPFDIWYKTVPESKNDTTHYNLRRAYDLAPKKDLDAFVENEDAHLMSAYENKQTGNYEFMKSKSHPTLKMELDWYNSKEGKDFKSRYELVDDGTDYYQYKKRK